LIKLEVEGYVIIDDETSLPVDSEEPVSATAYKCTKSKCTIVSKFDEGKRLLNAIAEDNALVTYVDGLWKVETDPGYYFFGSDVTPVVKNGVVLSAIEVSTDSNGKTVQRDITVPSEIGFYMNKATSEKVILSNDNLLWSKGTALQNCNVTAVPEGGINCRTLVKDTTSDAGNYCYDKIEEKLYLLTKMIDDVTETEDNCIAGSNEEPLYLSTISTLNGESTDGKLTRLTDDSIKVVSPGIYMLNVNGTLVEDNNNGELEVFVWNCNESGCTKDENIDADIMFLSQSGDIFVYRNEGEEENVKKVLRKVDQEGLYFFNEEGKGCSADDDVVTTIIEIANDGTKKSVEIDEMAEGAYVNGCNDKTLMLYADDEWSIIASECTINEENNSCESNVVDIEVGAYCIINGKIAVVSEVDEENKVNVCVSGNSESPLYKFDDEGELLAIKEKEISIVKK